MALVAVEPGKENHASLVILRWCLKDFPRQRNCRLDDRAETLRVSIGKMCQCAGSLWCDRVENTKQCMAVLVAVAFDQRCIIEIIARETQHAFWEAVAECDFIAFFE